MSEPKINSAVHCEEVMWRRISVQSQDNKIDNNGDFTWQNKRISMQ